MTRRTDFITKEAVKCYRATEIVVRNHNRLKPNDKLTVLGVLHDLSSDYAKTANKRLAEIYEAAFDLAWLDKTVPERRQIKDLDAEIATWTAEHGNNFRGISLAE